MRQDEEIVHEALYFVDGYDDRRSCNSHEILEMRSNAPASSHDFADHVGQCDELKQQNQLHIVS
jgi:hypothetical protein